MTSMILQRIRRDSEKTSAWWLYESQICRPSDHAGSTSATCAARHQTHLGIVSAHSRSAGSVLSCPSTSLVDWWYCNFDCSQSRWCIERPDPHSQATMQRCVTNGLRRHK